MTAAALSSAAAALWPGLLRLLRRLGRWVLDKLIDWGARYVLDLMRDRIAVRFPEQIRQAIECTASSRTKAGKRHWRMRRRRIQRRLARWQAAAAWLSTHATRLKPGVLEQFEQLAAKIPETAPWERAA